MTSAHQAPLHRRPRIALVLSSGGLNPLAAIPLIEFLEANGVCPDLLVGCSGGSLPLGLLAIGEKPSEMIAFFKRALKPSMFPKDWDSLSIMLGLRRKPFSRRLSIFNTRPYRRILEEVLGERRLEDLPIPLVLQATDFETGEGVELDSGRMADCVYATCAAYPFFHPLEIDGRWLFDGVFSAPLPVLAAVRRKVDLVIAVDFLEKLQGRPAHFIESMVHLHKIFTKTVSQSQTLASFDLHGHEAVYVKVRFSRYISLWDTEAYDPILAAGHQAVEEYGPEILASIKAIS